MRLPTPVPPRLTVRVFRDVYPASDGKLHLEFLSSWGRPAFVSALEITPGTPGKLKPIRISAHQSGFVDADGTHWSGDNYFIEGRTILYRNPETGPKIPTLYTGERHGNFSYAIPVAPGSYTVKLHFLESFFSPLIPAAGCRGAGCQSLRCHLQWRPAASGLRYFSGSAWGVPACESANSTACVPTAKANCCSLSRRR